MNDCKRIYFELYIKLLKCFNFKLIICEEKFNENIVDESDP